MHRKKPCELNQEKPRHESTKKTRTESDETSPRWPARRRRCRVRGLVRRRYDWIVESERQWSWDRDPLRLGRAPLDLGHHSCTTGRVLIHCSLSPTTTKTRRTRRDHCDPGRHCRHRLGTARGRSIRPSTTSRQTDTARDDVDSKTKLRP